MYPNLNSLEVSIARLESKMDSLATRSDLHTELSQSIDKHVSTYHSHWPQIGLAGSGGALLAYLLSEIFKFF